MNTQRVTTPFIFMGLLSVIGVIVYFAITFPAASKAVLLTFLAFLVIIGTTALLWELSSAIKDKFFD